MRYRVGAQPISTLVHYRINYPQRETQANNMKQVKHTESNLPFKKSQMVRIRLGFTSLS